MAAELTYEEHEERRSRRLYRQKEWYRTLTPQQRQQRKRRATDMQRKRRARLREHGKLAVDANAPISASQPAKPAQAVALKAQNLADYDSVSAQRAQSLQRVWREEVSEYLLNALTTPESPFTGAGMRTSQMLCYWYGLGDKLDRIVESDKPEMTQEFTLAVLLECLRRLSGNKSSVSIPVLPGTI